MYKEKIRIAITGASGRMGKKLIQTVLKKKNVTLGAVLVNKNSLFFGSDVGEMIGVEKIGVIIQNSLDSVKNYFDILIDFSCPEGTLHYLKFCRQHKKSMIIGTTGFNRQEEKEIYMASNDIAIVLSNNFSIGVNIILKLLEKITKIMGKYTDIAIIESHHRYKMDSPSGTALEMGKVITDIIDQNLKEKNIKFTTDKNIRNNVAKKISFSSIRAGDIAGEHTVIFADIGERVEITHKVSNRTIFADGALKAAFWIKRKQKGLFNMKDVLELHEL